MKKVETAPDHEIAAMDVAMENQDASGLELLDKSEVSKESDLSEESESLEESELLEESESSEENAGTDARQERLEQLFRLYPATLESLIGDTGFEVSEPIERFMSAVEGYARGSGCERDTLDQSLAMLFSIGRGVREGSMNLDMLDTVTKGMIHDETLAREVKAAELRGRNYSIESGMRTRGGNDGVPHIEARGGTPGTSSRNRGIFGLAEGAR